MSIIVPHPSYPMTHHDGAGIPGANKVYVAEYVSSITAVAVNGKSIQVVKGSGFGKLLI